jgi:RNA polymerase sigma factor (sigma-70 family)
MVRSTNPLYIAQAAKLFSNGPEGFERVKAGEISFRVVDCEKKKQKREARRDENHEIMSDSALEHMFSAARRIAAIRAKAAIRADALAPAGFDDLVQAGLIACWHALRKFDANRASSRTFFDRVIATSVASTIRAARRKPAFRPLDSARECMIASKAGAIDLQIDVCRVLSQLDLEDRQVALALMQYSPAEASRKLNIARSTVYQRMRKLRAAFTEAGLAGQDGSIRS